MLTPRTKYLVLAVGVLVLSSSYSLFAQPRPRGFGGGPGPGQGGPMGIPGIGPVDLRHEAVRKELELLDSQIAELEQFGEEIREMTRKAITRMREEREQGQAGDPQQLQQLFGQIGAKVQQRLEEILLPHQMTRLKQLQLQARLRVGNFAILSPDVAEQLGINEQQREQLRTKAGQVEQDLRKKIADLRRQAQEELISLLSPEQQAKYQALVGAPFEFPAPPRPGGRAGGGGGRPPRPEGRQP